MYINKRTLKDEKKYKNKIKFIYDRHRAQVLSDGMEKRKQILIYIKWYKCTLCNLAFDYLISLEPLSPGKENRGRTVGVPSSDCELSQPKIASGVAVSPKGKIQQSPSVPNSPHTPFYPPMHVCCHVCMRQ